MTLTTVKPKRGRKVHAAVLTEPRTLCSRAWQGWLVASSPTTCARCLAAIERMVVKR
jgi:hypothetical protein